MGKNIRNIATWLSKRNKNKNKTKILPTIERNNFEQKIYKLLYKIKTFSVSNPCVNINFKKYYFAENDLLLLMVHSTNYIMTYST